MKKTEQAIQYLKKLSSDKSLKEKGWDGYDGDAIRDVTFQKALSFLEALQNGDIFISPVCDDSIMFEIQSKQGRIVITISQNDEKEYKNIGNVSGIIKELEVSNETAK